MAEQQVAQRAEEDQRRDPQPAGVRGSPDGSLRMPRLRGTGDHDLVPLDGHAEFCQRPGRRA
ncbi:MAG TPA: hypothetical protein VJL31_19620, partial [Gemmatimonadales bacterium]|nr:hypothetical protein [Gemmatimonadales bacterium]